MVSTIREENLVRPPQRPKVRNRRKLGGQKRARIEAQSDAAVIAVLARFAWVNEGRRPGCESEYFAEVAAQFRATRALLERECKVRLSAAPLFQ